MGLYIGIEGVGVRQSVIACADETGKVLAGYRLLGEPLSLQGTPRLLLRSRLSKLLREIARLTNRTLDELADAVVCIGVAGVTSPFDSETDLSEEIANLDITLGSLICTGDAELVLASHAASTIGSTILCNVNSTAYVATADRKVRYGGWGPAFRNEGSGYWMGKEALQEVAEECSRRSPPSEIWRRVDSWLLEGRLRDYPDWHFASIVWRRYRNRFLTAARGYDVRAALIGFANEMSIHHQWEWRSTVAGLAVPVLGAWEHHDATAAHIVETAAKHLAAQLKRACEGAGTNELTEPLVLYGGVLSHHPRFRRLLVKEVSDSIGTPQRILNAFESGTMRPVCGALLYALGNSKTGKLSLPSPAIIDRLRVQQAHIHREGELKND